MDTIPPLRTTPDGLRGPGGLAVPGPVDRVGFFEEQRRRRRQTWRYTTLSALAAAVVGVPLAMFVTPFAYLLVVGGLRLAERWTPVPEVVWSNLREVARFVPDFLNLLADAPDAEFVPWLRHAVVGVDYPFGSPALALAALIVPGMATMLLLWLGYRALFRKAGVGGTLLALGAREPRLDDLEERQLVNLVEEMAIASGLPPLRVRLLDSGIPNAAAVGSSIHDATLVVTRGLLDHLDRDETQGVIAHLVGSVGNGDLRIALSITTVFQAIELVFTGFDALFNLSGAAWRDLFWTLRLAVTGGSDRRAAEVVARMMDHRLGETREDGIVALLGAAESERPRSGLARLLKRLPFLYIVFFPFLILYILSLFLRMQVGMVRITVVGPLLMRVWRTRRFLADATAVQLTRNPEGLALAMGHLAAAGALVPGGQWFAHLFVVGPEAQRARADRALQQHLAELRDQAGKPGAGSSVASAAAGLRVMQQHMQQQEAHAKGTWSDELGGVASHPQIHQRVHRLGKLGARLRARSGSSPPAATLFDARSAASSTGAGRRARFAGSFLGVLGTVVLVPLMVLAFWLMACVMIAVFLFGVVAAVFFMGMAMAGIHALLA